MIAKLLAIALSLGSQGPEARAHEVTWACGQNDACLAEIRKMPLTPAEIAMLARLATETARLKEIRLGVAADGAAEDRQLASLSQRYLQLASDCRDVADDHSCRRPLAWVRGITAGLRFEEGSAPSDDTKAVVFRWDDSARERARRWVKDALCGSTLTDDEVVGFEGLTLYSGSCFPQSRLRSWFSNIFSGQQPDVCHNIIYNGRDSRMHVTADFIWNTRLGWNNGVKDATTRVFEHELAHHQNFRDPRGKKEAKEFTSLRYKTILPEYQRGYAVILKQLQTDAHKGTPHAFENFQAALLALCKRVGMPLRWGEGTGLELRAGLTVQGAGLLDTHAMENEFEYYAVAIELYRHDRARALQTYSTEELTWLAAHVRS